jgi:hypothetical protein
MGLSSSVAGFDHIYIYDNTAINTTAQEIPTHKAIAQFCFVTLHPWPAKIVTTIVPTIESPRAKLSTRSEASCFNANHQQITDTDEHPPMRNASGDCFARG